MIPNHKIIYVYCGDWEGFYINGELEYENHSIPTRVWMDTIAKYRFFSQDIEIYYVDDDYMEDRGSFPHEFSDLPKEVLSE